MKNIFSGKGKKGPKEFHTSFHELSIESHVVEVDILEQGRVIFGEQNSSQKELNKTMQRVTSGYAELLGQKSDLSKENQKLEAKLNRHKNISAEANSYIQKFTETYISTDNMKKEKEKLEKEFAELKNKRTEILSKKDPLKNYPKDLDEIKNDIESIDNQLNYYRNKPKPQELIDIENKISDFEQQKLKFLEQIEEKNKEIKTQRNYSDELQTKFYQLKEEEIKAKETINKKEEELSQKKKNVEFEYSQIEDKISEAKRKESDCNSMIKGYEKENENIKIEGQKANEALQKSVDELKAQIEMERSYMISSLQFSELYSDSLFVKLTKSKSYTVSEIVEHLIVNFNTIVCTLFAYDSEGSCIILPKVSLPQQRLKQIFFLLYAYTQNSLNKMNKNNPQNYQPISFSDINNDIIEQIVKSLYDNNEILNFKEKKDYCEEYLKNNQNLNLNSNIVDDINKGKQKRYDRMKNNLIQNIRNLVVKCAQMIKNGFIQIHDLKLFNFEILSKSNVCFENESLVINCENFDENILEYYLCLIKYPLSNIKGIVLKGNLKENNNKAFYQIFELIMSNFSQNILLVNFINFNCSCEIMEIILKCFDNLSNLKRLCFGQFEDFGNLIQTIILQYSANQKLEELSFDNCKFTQTDLSNLRGFLSKNENISTISFPHCNITNDNLKIILEIINTTPHLKKINLTDNHFNSNDFRQISSFLMKDPHLEELNISNNKLEMEESAEFGKAMSICANINVLNISDLEIVADLSPTVFQRFMAVEVYLDNNPLEDIGNMMLSKCIMSSPNLKKISMNNTMMTSISFTQVMGAIQRSTSLEEIFIKGNTLSKNDILIANKMIGNKKCKVYCDAIKVTMDQIRNEGVAICENIIVNQI